MQNADAFYSPIWSILAFAVALGLSQIFVKFRLAAPSTQNSGRFGEIDGLRGILAFSVVLTHLASSLRYHIDATWTWPPSKFYTMLGHIPVSLFFMITGFLFWGRAIDKTLNWKGFLIGRIFRIMPLYLVATASLVTIALWKSGGALRVDIFDFLSQTARWLALGVFGRPDINGLKDTWVINPATWTLRPEALFYLALPIAAPFATLRRFAALSAVVATVAIYRNGINGGWIWVHFLYGMAAAHLYRYKPEIPALASRGLSVLLLIYLAVRWRYNFDGYGLIYALSDFPIFLCILYGNSFFGLLKMTAMRHMGDISYSVYLLHCPIIFVLFTLISHKTDLSTISPAIYWTYALTIASLIICASTVTYLLVEKPMINFGSSITRRVKKLESTSVELKASN